MEGFESVVGYEDVKMELMRYADTLKHPDKYKKLGIPTPHGVLLYGNPGVGKTTMAEAFVSLCNLPTFHLRKEKSSKEFIDEIRETFVKARESAPSVVFLDDMDKFANEDYIHRDAPEYVTVQTGIDDSRGHSVFVIATANDKRGFPSSLIRVGRFDRVIEIHEPTGKDSEKIIQHYLGKKSVMSDIDVELIVRLMEGKTCAELESVINEAGIYAGYAGRDKIAQGDFLKACLSMVYVNKKQRGQDPFDEDEEVLIDSPIVFDAAVHEVGHAVVAEVLEPGSVSVISTNPIGKGCAGVTIIRQAEELPLSRDLMENDVVCRLGGCAASEVVLGKRDIKGELDLFEASNRVGNLVGGVTGLISVQGRVSDDYIVRREHRIELAMEKYYQKAVEIIVENRALFDALLAEVLEKETLTYKDIAEIRAHFSEKEY